MESKEFHSPIVLNHRSPKHVHNETGSFLTNIWECLGRTDRSIHKLQTCPAPLPCLISAGRNCAAICANKKQSHHSLLMKSLFPTLKYDLSLIAAVLLSSTVLCLFVALGHCQLLLAGCIAAEIVSGIVVFCRASLCPAIPTDQELPRNRRDVMIRRRETHSKVYRCVACFPYPVRNPICSWKASFSRRLAAGGVHSGNKNHRKVHFYAL